MTFLEGQICVYEIINTLLIIAVDLLLVKVKLIAILLNRVQIFVILSQLGELFGRVAAIRTLILGQALIVPLIDLGKIVVVLDLVLILLLCAK